MSGEDGVVDLLGASSRRHDCAMQEDFEQAE